jgi:hypothetical protein
VAREEEKWDGGGGRCNVTAGLNVTVWEGERDGKEG